MQAKHAMLVGVCSLGLLPALPAEDVSVQTKERVLAVLPHYQPSAPEAAAVSPVGTPAPLSDDPLITLPNFIVRDKPIPTNEPDKWLTRRALQAKTLAEYRDSMTDLEWFLNCWHIPLLTPSAQDRADAAHESRRIAGEVARFKAIAKAVGLTDPKEAARLRDAMDLSKLP